MFVYDLFDDRLKTGVEVSHMCKDHIVDSNLVKKASGG